MSKKKKRFPNYLKKLRAPKDGPGLYHITVTHDDWCDVLTGKSLICNCNPNISDPIRHEDIH